MDVPADDPHDDVPRTPSRPPGELLATLLAGAESLIPFAAAVVDQVGAHADTYERDTILGDVAGLLQVAVDPEEEVPIERLAANPTLLASFFQNVDLLDPAASETDVVARLVMGAVERLEYRGA